MSDTAEEQTTTVTTPAELTTAQPTAAAGLRARMRAQQQAPGNPAGGASTPTQPAETNITQPAAAPTKLTLQPNPRTPQSEKASGRQTHFVDDNGIPWTRTGHTLPAAYWRGIVAYTNKAKMTWQPGQEKVTQQQVINEALSTWLNDHRAELPPEVNAECDQVRATLKGQ